MTDQQRAAQAAAEGIRVLNDHFRQSLTGGSLMLTIGVIKRGCEFQDKALTRLRAYADFTSDNDPYGEHDFGSLEVDGVRLFFKIDYYERSLASQSPDPSDATRTHRVLTLMLAEEY